MASAKHVVTDLAKSDFREIIGYVRVRNPSAAKALRLKFYADIRRLGEFPYLGHARPDVTSQPLRFWSVFSYLIVYRPDPRPIEIIRILHGARDLPPSFRS